MLDHPAQSLPGGTTLGRYAVVELVGMGGVAEVYEAVHLELQKRVALKVLRQEVREHPEVRARFLREGKNAAAICHPNVVDIYDVGELNDLPYLVMEHLSGETLARHLEREGQLSELEASQLMLPVLAGVLAGHEQGVVHRDLKPENIFLAQDGRRRNTPTILDFGVSKALAAADGLTLPDTAIGTPHYMAPEQARGERPVTPFMDQYTLGVILFEMVTGRLPREDVAGHQLMEAIAFGTFEPPSRLRPDLDPALERVILRSMEATPGDRYPSLREMGSDLLRLANPRAREHWRSEFTDEPVPSTRRRATDPPPGAEAAMEAVRGSVPRLKAPIEAPNEAAAPWGDDEHTEFTDISAIIRQLPPDAQEAMERWRQRRRERKTTDSRAAARGSLQGPIVVASAPLDPIDVGPMNRRWVLLVLVAVVLATVALALALASRG